MQVGDEQEKRTQGLCGTYDNDHTNDFKRRDGKQGNHVMDFVESWSVGGKSINYC